MFFYGRAPNGVLDRGSVPPNVVARLEAMLPPDSRRLAEYDKVVAKVDLTLEAASTVGPLGRAVAAIGRLVEQLGRAKLEKGSVSREDFENALGNAVVGVLVGRIFRGLGNRLGAARRSLPDKPVGGLGNKLTEKWLKRKGINPHLVKEGLPGKPSRFNLYKDKAGNIWAQARKSRNPIYIGNLNEFKN